MNDEIESRSLRRRIVLMIMASAFLAWQIPGMDFIGNIAAGNDTVAGLISGTGFLVWAGALVFLLVTGRPSAASANPKVSAALEDELVRSNRSRSFVIGYAVTLTTSVLVFGLNLVRPISGLDAAHLILVAAVAAPMYAFVVLERANA